MERIPISRDLADNILVAARHRCCVCPQHERITNIHHIDKNPSNNDRDNLIGLCSKCHIDAHSSSSMRRNLTDKQLKQYRKNWEEQCAKTLPVLPVEVLTSFYYINIDRFTPLYRQFTGSNIITTAPYWFPNNGQIKYDTLWANKLNSLDWQQLLETRLYLEQCVKEFTSGITPLDFALFENEAADPREWQGEYITFHAEFYGKDIPDQEQLVVTRGDLDGPPPTLRREKISRDDERVFETCMMLNARFFYSDSAFLHFAESGFWSGVGICGIIRDAVGSNDQYRIRSQLLITPLWIGRGAACTI